MHGETSDIVGVGLKRRDFFVRVVIEDTELEVVGACDEPVLARNELATTHGDLGNLEGLYDGACLVVINVHGAVVEPRQQPWLSGVEVYALDSLGPVKQLPLKGMLGRGGLGENPARTLTSNNILAGTWKFKGL